MELTLPDEPGGPLRGPTPADLPPCETSSCVSGSSNVWVAQNGEHLLLRVGNRTFTVEPKPSSPLEASRTIFGVAVGARIALVDKGERWDILSVDGPDRSIPRPAGFDKLHGVWASSVGDGVILAAADGTEAADPVVLVPPTAPPPAPGFEPVPGPLGAIGAWVKRDEAGAQIVFANGTSLHTTTPYVPRHGASANNTLVVFGGEDERHVIGVDGSELHLPARVPFVMTLDYAVLLDDDKVYKVITPRQREEKLSFPPNSDFAGNALPDHAVVQRRDITSRKGRLLALERVRLASCKSEDRLHVLDTTTWSVTTLPTAAGKMRMHITPTPTGFSFVEADAEYSSE